VVGREERERNGKKSNFAYLITMKERIERKEKERDTRTTNNLHIISSSLLSPCGHKNTEKRREKREESY